MNRPNSVWTTMALVYVAIMVGAALSGSFFFIAKTVLVPGILAAALLSGMAVPFLRDWLVFISFSALFDALRGFVFTAVSRYDLPVRMAYAARAEQTILCGHIAPAALQSALFAGRAVGWFERLMVLFHASHFLFFFGFGLVVWLRRRKEYERYARAMMLLMCAGIAGYILFPTVPPWMASAAFDAITPVEKIRGLVYNAALPALQAHFDTNPIAAMPSLHAGFPFLCALIALRLFGWRAWWTAAYAAVVAFAVIYLGDHYFVDVLAGWLVAGGIFLFMYRPRPNRESRPMSFRAVLAISVLLLAGSEGLGRYQESVREPYVPSRDFVQHLGKTALAADYAYLRDLRDSEAGRQALRRAMPFIRTADVQGTAAVLHLDTRRAGLLVTLNAP